MHPNPLITNMAMRKALVLMALAGLALLLALAGFGRSDERRLVLDVVADRDTGVQLYYDQGAGFSEANSRHVALRAGTSRQTVTLPRGGLRMLRIDPEPAAAELRLEVRRLAIEDMLTGRIASLPLEGLSGANEITSLAHTPAGVVAHTKPGSSDPQLLLAVHDAGPVQGWTTKAAAVLRLLVALIAIAWLVWFVACRRRTLPAAAMLSGAGLLAAAMAFISPTSHPVHPDEYLHVASAKYYFSHWMPPAVDNPDIVDSYSGYGMSYSNELDVVYPLAANVSQVWSGFGFDRTTVLRGFNLLLLGVLAVIAARWRSTWPAMAVLLVTPQVWYVFSYFNADALPLFLSMVVVLLFAPPSSPVSRFIEGQPASRLALAAFCIALGLLLVSKRNFLPVVFVLGLMIAVRHFGTRSWQVAVAGLGAGLVVARAAAGEQLGHAFAGTAPMFLPVGAGLLLAAAAPTMAAAFRSAEVWTKVARAGLLVGIAILIAIPRIATDLHVNGGPAAKSAAMAAATERYADPVYKPSTMAASPAASHPSLHWMAKQVTYDELVFDRGWAASNWRSFLGVYGYMSVFASDAMYRVNSVGLLAFLIGVIGWAARYPQTRPEALVALLGTVLVLASSMFHSWANDFQPQGRYLFPALAVFAMFLLANPRLGANRAFRTAVIIAFMASVVSFVTVGLPALAVS